MKLKKGTSGGEITLFYVIELLSQTTPLSFMHRRTAQNQMPRATMRRASIAGLVDIQDVRKKGG